MSQALSFRKRPWEQQEEKFTNTATASSTSTNSAAKKIRRKSTSNTSTQKSKRKNHKSVSSSQPCTIPVPSFSPILLPDSDGDDSDIDAQNDYKNCRINHEHGDTKTNNNTSQMKILDYIPKPDNVINLDLDDEGGDDDLPGPAFSQCDTKPCKNIDNYTSQIHIQDSKDSNDHDNQVRTTPHNNSKEETTSCSNDQNIPSEESGGKNMKHSSSTSTECKENVPTNMATKNGKKARKISNKTESTYKMTINKEIGNLVNKYNIDMNKLQTKWIRQLQKNKTRTKKNNEKLHTSSDTKNCLCKTCIHCNPSLQYLIHHPISEEKYFADVILFSKYYSNKYNTDQTAFINNGNANAQIQESNDTYNNTIKIIMMQTLYQMLHQRYLRLEKAAQFWYQQCNKLKREYRRLLIDNGEKLFIDMQNRRREFKMNLLQLFSDENPTEIVPTDRNTPPPPTAAAAANDDDDNGFATINRDSGGSNHKTLFIDNATINSSNTAELELRYLECVVHNNPNDSQQNSIHNDMTSIHHKPNHENTSTTNLVENSRFLADVDDVPDDLRCEYYGSRPFSSSVVNSAKNRIRSLLLNDYWKDDKKFCKLYHPIRVPTRLVVNDKVFKDCDDNINTNKNTGRTKKKNSKSAFTIDIVNAETDEEKAVVGWVRQLMRSMSHFMATNNTKSKCQLCSTCTSCNSSSQPLIHQIMSPCQVHQPDDCKSKNKILPDHSHGSINDSSDLWLERQYSNRIDQIDMILSYIHQLIRKVSRDMRKYCKEVYETRNSNIKDVVDIRFDSSDTDESDYEETMIVKESIECKTKYAYRKRHQPTLTQMFCDDEDIIVLNEEDGAFSIGDNESSGDETDDTSSKVGNDDDRKLYKQPKDDVPQDIFHDLREASYRGKKRSFWSITKIESIPSSVNIPIIFDGLNNQNNTNLSLNFNNDLNEKILYEESVGIESLLNYFINEAEVTNESPITNDTEEDLLHEKRTKEEVFINDNPFEVENEEDDAAHREDKVDETKHVLDKRNDDAEFVHDESKFDNNANLSTTSSPIKSCTCSKEGSLIHGSNGNTDGECRISTEIENNKKDISLASTKMLDLMLSNESYDMEVIIHGLEASTLPNEVTAMTKGCENNNISKSNTESNSPESEKVRFSQLSPSCQSLSKSIESDIESNCKKLEMIESIVPNWRENIRFALGNDDVDALDDALSCVKEQRRKLDLIKTNFLNAIQKRELVLELFENVLDKSLMHKNGNDR